MFYELIHFKISPILLLTLGLSFELLGGILIALDAVGIKDFLLKYRSDIFYEKRKADLGITAFINRSIAFIIFGTVFAVLTTAIGLDLGFALLLAPLGFVVHRFISSILKAVYQFIRSHPPKIQGGCIVSLIGLFFSLLWAIPLLITFFVWVVFDLGFELLIYGFAEKFLKPLVIKSFIWFEKKCINRGESWYIKTYIISGILLIFFGFLYQIIGTILVAFS